MRNIVNNLFVLFSIALILNTSCATDEPDIGNNNLVMNLSFGTLKTKAPGEEVGNYEGSLNEDKINSLDIFFYQENTLKWHASTVNSGISYNDSDLKATVPITSAKNNLFPGTYDIYIIANNKADLSSISEGAVNLNDLKNLVFQTSEFQTKGGYEAQTDFLMDGTMPNKVINVNNPFLGTVSLKRAAAKIRMRLINVAVPGYTQYGTATARLVHFTDKSVLLEEGTAAAISKHADWKTSSDRNIASTLPYGLNGLSTAAPFYAYANNWSSDPDKETYLELYIPLKGNTSNVTDTYKYLVPITPGELTGEDSKYRTNLFRNHLYDIAVDIRILGGLDERPVIATGNCTIIDWNTMNVLIDIKGAHYLVVSESNIVMPNISTYTLTFNSSIADVKLVSGSLKASYTYVDANSGTVFPVAITTGSQYPSVSLQSGVASGTIVITSAIPVNQIPKDIEFKLTNGHLTETVVVRQLPPTYFTTEKGNRSNLRNQLDAEHTNPYMYSITTLAPSGSIIWGFPPVDSKGNTINSAEVANMVSPKFMMASQMGATSSMSYNNGATNCQDYWEETTKNGLTVRYSDWRLPTEAEIRYIDDLQHDSNNPQGVVMRGNYYWDAYNANNAYRMKAPISTSASSTSAHVRCIRDIKD